MQVAVQEALKKSLPAAEATAFFFNAIGSFFQAKQVKMSWELVDGLKYD